MAEIKTDNLDSQHEGRPVVDSVIDGAFTDANEGVPLTGYELQQASGSLAVYSSAGVGYARVINILGSTITSVGAACQIFTGTRVSCDMLTSTTAIATWYDSGLIKAAVFTISGSTVTSGAVVSVGAADDIQHRSVKLTSSLALSFYRQTKGYYKPLTISGTTITVGDVFCFDANSVSYIDAARLSDSQALIVYLRSGSTIYRRTITP